MYITEVLTKTTTGKIAHRCILLRESYREHGKVKTRTLANLTHCPPHDVTALRWALHHKHDLLSPADSAGLLERLERDALTTDDRHLLVRVIRATQASQKLLEQPVAAAPPATRRKAKRHRQVANASRRRQQREGEEPR